MSGMDGIGGAGLGPQVGGATGSRLGRGGALPGVGGAGETPSFKDTLTQALEDVSGLQEEAKDSVTAFLRGEPVELHEVMAAAEEAGLALEMLVEVRNKLAEAYRAVVQMQS